MRRRLCRACPIIFPPCSCSARSPPPSSISPPPRSATASDRGARLLAGIAAAAMLQLAAEVSRTFVAYSYPWHIARVSAIALLAAIDRDPDRGLCRAPLRARRSGASSWPRPRSLRRRASSSSPGTTSRRLAAILAGAARPRRLPARSACAIGGPSPRSRWPRPRLLIVLIALAAAPPFWTGPIICCSGRRCSSSWSPSRSAASAAPAPSATPRPAARRRWPSGCARAEREGEPIVALKDGSRTHRVAESDIVAIRAADDYCDVVLRGRPQPAGHDEPRAPARHPARPLRCACTRATRSTAPTSPAIAPRPGGGRLLLLSDGRRCRSGEATRGRRRPGS